MMVRKKAAAKKTTPTRESRTAKTSGRAGVSVRMYRQGLGDCFLITLPSEKGKRFHMLIDCGVIVGTSDAKKRMNDVVNDIILQTNSQIDLLVITHEHMDHVSGFNQAKDLFDKVAVKDVWVAWTEDPKDQLATKLRTERRRAENALRMAVNHLALSGNAAKAQRISSLMDFMGAKAGSTSDAMDYAKNLSGSRPRYCQPGEPPITLPQLPGFRFWVLGPPKDEKLIKKSAPGKGEGYGLDAGPGGTQSLLLTSLTRGQRTMNLEDIPDREDLIEEPFEDRFTIPLERAEHVPFFEKHYFGESADGSIVDEDSKKDIRDQSWRRIDATWMDASETLALQLDSATNNTSLVLAIEVVTSGEVLLFPGDAQAGNWLSWQDLEWKVDDTKSGKRSIVTGPDLLARTIFYKVGHHGSHNATLQEKGLELMVHDDLIAMIPVDHAMAIVKRWERMPLPGLVDRLKEKTDGRILRIDDIAKKSSDLGKLKPDRVTAAEWKRFTDRVNVTPLFYEVSF